MAPCAACADDQGVKGNKLAATLGRYLTEALHVRVTDEDLEALGRQARDRSNFKTKFTPRSC